MVADVRVLLIGNYPHDEQQSMQRFAVLMVDQLQRAGILAKRIQPTPVFGKMKPGGHGLGKWLGYFDKFLLFPLTLKRELRRHSPDGPVVVHICDHSNAHYTRYLREIPHLVTCHDLLAVRSARGEVSQNPTGPTGRILQEIISRGLVGAKAIVCISNATRDALLRIIQPASTRVEVIYNGLNYPFRRIGREKAIEHLRSSDRADVRDFFKGPAPHYIFHVGGNQWYKNRPGVLKIYFEYRAKFPGNNIKLVMAGKEPSEAMKKIADAHPGFAQDVIYFPNISELDLEALYNAAEVLLFPSFAEGFGWPIIEAQACGCRVVTAGRAPMTEVAGDGAIYIDPENVGMAAAQLDEALKQKEDKRARFVAACLKNSARFTTKQMLEQYIALYQKLVR